MTQHTTFNMYGVCVACRRHSDFDGEEHNFLVDLGRLIAPNEVEKVNTIWANAGAVVCRDCSSKFNQLIGGLTLERPWFSANCQLCHRGEIKPIYDEQSVTFYGPRQIAACPTCLPILAEAHRSAFAAICLAGEQEAEKSASDLRSKIYAGFQALKNGVQPP